MRQERGEALDRETDWFGHPRGLTILFLTETWEKFSYYGMRAILVYYMTKQLLFTQGHASFVYGLYTGCAYLTPLIGGPLSDRWLGRQRAIVIGGVVMAVGHFMMAFDSLIYVALATIAVGNGLYLPNLPAQIEPIYARGDPRSKGAINVYYVGVNLGAFLAPLAIGTVGEVYGWHYGFTLAGIGMITGLAIYLAGRRWLPVQTLPRRMADVRVPMNMSVRKRLGLLAAIMAVVIVLRAAYEQNGNTLPLWADTGIDRRIGQWTIPMTWFVALNPLVVFVLTPPLVSYWARRAASGREQRTALKMCWGAGIVALAFFLLAGVAGYAGDIRVSWIWLAIFFVILTVGELFVLPVGLGLFVRIAPVGLAATGVAIWFGAAFLGSFASGLLGQYWSVMSPAQFFAMIGAICLVPAFVLLAFDRPIRAAEADAAAVRADGLPVLS